MDSSPLIGADEWSPELCRCCRPDVPEISGENPTTRHSQGANIVAKVMQAQLAEVGVLAYSVPTGYEPVGVIDAGKAGEQKSVRVTATGQRVNDGAGSIAERHDARAGFRVLKIERDLSDVASA